MPESPLLEVRNLSAANLNGDPLLQGISLQLYAQSRTVLLGASGAGKTAIVRHLFGDWPPPPGTVFVKGVEVARRTGKRIRRIAAWVEQDVRASIFTRTVWEYVTKPLLQAGGKADIIRKAETALSCVGMLKYKQASLADLPLVDKRKAAIARAVAGNPELIVLDEPVSGLDASGQSELAAILRSLHLMGTAILLVTHDVDFAASWEADQLILAAEGRILATGDARLTADAALMKRARLRLPLVLLPFTLVPEWEAGAHPRSLQEAVRLLRRMAQHTEKPPAGNGRPE